MCYGFDFDAAGMQYRQMIAEEAIIKLLSSSSYEEDENILQGVDECVLLKVVQESLRTLYSLLDSAEEEDYAELYEKIASYNKLKNDAIIRLLNKQPLYKVIGFTPYDIFNSPDMDLVRINVWQIELSVPLWWAKSELPDFDKKVERYLKNVARCLLEDDE